MRISDRWRRVGRISTKVFIVAYLSMATFDGLILYNAMRAINPLGAFVAGITGPAVQVCNMALSSMPCSGAKLIPNGHEYWLFSFEGDTFYRKEV